MKKGKMIIGTLALVVAIGSALAFKAKTLPGDLYYVNSESLCVQAPCSKVDQGPQNPCQITPIFDENTCSTPYEIQAWTTECGIK